MAYIELAGSRVSSIFLRYLADKRIYPALFDVPKSYDVVNTHRLPDGFNVTFADKKSHDFTDKELKQHSNFTDNTSPVYPFKHKVPRIREECVEPIVDYDDKESVKKALKKVGFCVAVMSEPEINVSQIAGSFSSVTVVPGSNDPPPSRYGLRSSGHVNQKFSPDIRIVQGPFSGQIVNGIRVYSKIRALERQERAAESVVYSGSRIQNESSGILEYTPVQLVHSCENPQYCSSGPRYEPVVSGSGSRIQNESSTILEYIPVQEVHSNGYEDFSIKPTVSDDRIHMSGKLPNPSLHNFHEYVGYYSNFLRTCYTQAVKIELAPGEVLIYSDRECLTSYTGGNRVIEVKRADAL